MGSKSRDNSLMKSPLLLLVSLALMSVPGPAVADDVIGCGGFIKASRVLDFSRINVELYSKSGSLKYETECAPNNGYFFIPVYEKGTYTIKVSPPLGWQFSPAEVVVDIDGVSDDCSVNKDINFNFDGFGVVGRVITAGTSSGPAGVTISLKTGSETLQTTVTGEDGRYVFTAVPGTDHHVTASHPSWVFDKDMAKVSMTGDNGEAEDLVISGFDVRGEVIQAGAGGEAMPGVSVLLLGSSDLTKSQCPDNTPVSGAAIPAGLRQLCTIKTDNKGRFVFPVVPPGAYKLVPFYQTSATKFEVSPGSMSVNVKSGSVLLPSPFTVSGFSVSGSVLTAPSGSPVSGAQVTLTAAGKKFTVVTDVKGSYQLESITSATYTISATSPGYEFSPVTAAVSPSSPVLPVVAASRYEVVGQLDYSTVAHDAARVMIISSRKGAHVIATVDKTGKFSTMLPSDTYALSIKSTSVDEQMGIVFAPVTLDINVKDKPITDLYFSPVRVTVSGSVKCLGDCPAITITLKPEGFGKDIKMPLKNGQFMFENQLPGSYIALVSGEGLCFESDSVPFKIESDPVNNLHFKQTGWVMEVHSTHETVVKFSDSGSSQGDLDIPIGHSVHCMPAPGPYSLATTSCHMFHQDEAANTWSAGGRVRLRAVRHLVSGSVTSTEMIPDLQMMVTTESKEVHTIALTSPENKDGLFVYK